MGNLNKRIEKFNCKISFFRKSSVVSVTEREPERIIKIKTKSNCNPAFKISALDDANMLFVTTAYEPIISIWHNPKEKLMKRFTGHNQQIWNLIKLSDGSILSARQDTTIKKWNVWTGACLETLTSHQQSTVGLLELSGKKLITGGYSMYNRGEVKFWNNVEGKYHCYSTLHVRGGCCKMILLNDEMFAFGSYVDIVIMHIGNEEAQQILRGHWDVISSLIQLQDKKILCSASTDGTIKTWNWMTGDMLKSVLAHSDSVSGLMIHSPNVIASSGADGVVRLWKIDQSNDIKLISACKVSSRKDSVSVSGLTFIKPGVLMLGGGDQRLYFFTII